MLNTMNKTTTSNTLYDSELQTVKKDVMKNSVYFERSHFANPLADLDEDDEKCKTTLKKTSVADSGFNSDTEPSESELITGLYLPEESSKPELFPTMSELRNAVPQHCFERSALKSIAYVVFDYSIIYALYKLLPYVEPTTGWLGLFVWYWVTGLFYASVFVIGHDCGHGSFSKYTWLNDLFGHICFGPIFSPYYGWQKTHRRHHQWTTHVDKDTSHPWVTKKDYDERNFISRNFCKLPFSGFFRWDPIYTVLGLPDGSHFWPYSRIFKSTRDRVECVVSAVVAAACVAAAFHICNYDIYVFYKYYWVPVHFQGFWIVAITFMQHNYEEVEVFQEGTWNYMKGQAETIDRVFGFGLDWILHHATDGHVAHHMFLRMPHYHLIEATKHIERLSAKYPNFYKKKPAPFSLLEFCWLNIKLNYLVPKSKGTLKYQCSKDFDKQMSQ